MLRTWRRRRLREDETSKIKSELSNVCRNSKQIIQWEQETLLLPDTYTIICSLREVIILLCVVYYFPAAVEKHSSEKICYHIIDIF